jgi:DNA transposition AAA+ family ATPase
MEKQQKIQQAIVAHLANTGDSQNTLAKKIDVSEATLSNIRNGKWANISPAMWNKIAAFLGVREAWTVFKTPNFISVCEVCADAQQAHKMLCVAAFTGAGKTTALREYAAKNPNVYYVLCTMTMGQKDLVGAILRSMGLENPGTVNSGLAAICAKLNETTDPLLLLDDAGKLKDGLLPIVQIIYDQTIEHGQGGIVLAGTEYLKKTIDVLAGKDKKGFREFQDRFVYWKSLVPPSPKVISQIAIEHGITDGHAVGYLHRMAKNYRQLRNLITNAKLAVTQQPELTVSAELLAGLHVGDHHYQSV